MHECTYHKENLFVIKACSCKKNIRIQQDYSSKEWA